MCDLPAPNTFWCLFTRSEYYHYRQVWIPLRWLPAESVFEDDFSTKTDVWSFGVLMWEVFSLGELPYTKLGDDEVLEGEPPSWFCTLSVVLSLLPVNICFPLNCQLVFAGFLDSQPPFYLGN